MISNSIGRLTKLMLAFCLVALIASQPWKTLHADDGGESAAFCLTILHSNDGESALLGRSVGAETYGGAAHFASLVWKEKLRARSSCPAPTRNASITVSAGNHFLAGPNFTASLANNKFYDARLIEIIGYDALAMGSHDFDFGPDILARFISQVRYRSSPFLSANLDFSAEPSLARLVNRGRIASSRVLRKNTERIGIVGATNPDLKFDSFPRNVQIAENMAAEIQADVNTLEARGINKIILISNLQSIDANIELVSKLYGVDVVVAGGGGELLANADTLLIPGHEEEIAGPYPLIAQDVFGANVPIVTTAGRYEYLGKLVVKFDGGGNVQGIDETASRPIRVAGSGVPDAVAPRPLVHNEIVWHVGHFVDLLHKDVIAVSEVELDGLRSSVHSTETNQGNLLADAILWQARQEAALLGVNPPVIALQNGGGMRGDSVLPPGEISLAHTFEIAPFSDFISVVEDVPREQFKEILENAVSRAGEGDTPGGSGRFAQIAGFTFTWNEVGTAQSLDDNATVTTPGTRVRNVTLDDGSVIISRGVVRPGPPLSIAIVRFLAHGGDQYPFRGAPLVNTGATYQQALANYIAHELGGVITEADYPAGGEGRIGHLTSTNSQTTTSQSRISE